MGLLSLLLLLLPLLRGGSLQELRVYKLDVQSSVSVQEGLCVFVPCAFSISWSTWTSWNTELHLYWFLEGGNEPYSALVATTDPSRAVKWETRGRFRLLGDPKARNCSLAVSPTRKADTGSYYLQVEQGGEKYSFRRKKLTLHVSALTEKPDILFGGPLQSGHPERLSCSLKTNCKGEGSLTFLWMGDALAPLGPESLQLSRLMLTPRPQDHGTNLTCRVTLPGVGVSTEWTVRLNVTYPPQNVTASISQGNSSAFRTLGNASSLAVLGGQALRLLCEADSNPPANLSWFRGPPGPNATPIASSATLELSAVGTPDAGELSCLAQHPLGSGLVSLNLLVQCPPRLLGPSCSREDEGLRCSCASSAQPAPSLRWRLGKQLLEGNSSDDSIQVSFSHGGSWANSSLSVHGELSSNLTLSCEAQNPHGTWSATLLPLPCQRIPAGTPGSRSGLVPGALMGAGAMAVLSLCLCLLFYGIRKARRHRGARRRAAQDDEDPITGAEAWGSKHKSQADSPVDPTGDAAASGEPQEIHYASLSFQGVQVRGLQEVAASGTTEYSEIRTRK